MTIQSNVILTDDIFNSKKAFNNPVLSDDNRLTYEKIFCEFDKITYTPISTGIKEEIILEKYTGSNVFEFTVEFGNLEPLYLKGDSIPLVDKQTGEQLASISQIDIKDSSLNFKTSLFNTIEMKKTNNNTYTLKLIIDKDFLKAESTVYPVVIDPTITFNADPIYDAPVFSGYPNTNFNSNTYNVVGYHGSSYGEGITFVKVNNLQNYTYINQDRISKAYLRLYEGSGKTASAKVNVYNTLATWDNTTITYNNMPSLVSTNYSSTSVTSSGWYNFDITALLRGWMRYEIQDGGKSQHHGIALKMSQTGVSGRYFASANNTSFPPSIIITYTPDTSIATGDYFIQSQYHPVADKLYCYLQSSSDQTNVLQYTGTGYYNQIWTVSHLGNGYYQLKLKANTSKLMATASSTPTNGTNIGLTTNASSTCTKFRLLKNVDNSYRIISACTDNNMALDVYGPSQEINTNIQTKKYTGASQQRWKFYRAAPQGRLDFWYSDSNMISCQANKSLKICVETSSGFGKFKSTLKSYVENGLDSWSDLGITYTFDNSVSNCNIYVKGVTRAEAVEMGFTDPTAAGVTTTPLSERTTATYRGNVCSPGGWKNTYSVTRKEVYIIWDTNDNDGTLQTSNYSTQKWQAVVAHEIGHALGYEGHTKQLSLMFSNISDHWAKNYNTPSDENLSHLRQLY